LKSEKADEKSFDNVTEKSTIAAAKRGKPDKIADKSFDNVTENTTTTAAKPVPGSKAKGDVPKTD
jgi:hypothetical protein